MKLNRYMDHTALKADTTYEMIDKLCEEAKNMTFSLFVLMAVM